MNVNRRRILLSTVLLTGCRLTASAQEALTRSVAADATAVEIHSRAENLPYTVRLKDLRLMVGVSAGVEWTDNVRLTQRARENDVLLNSRLDLHAFHPIGEANMLSLDVGLGYLKYLRNEDLDRLDVSQGSAVNFDLIIDRLKLNFHDRLSYQLDPVLQGAVSGRGSFGGIDNTAGLMADWHLGPVSFNLGYDFLKYLASSSEFEAMDRSSHQFLLRSGVQVHPAARVGVESTFNLSSYDSPSPAFNDSRSYSAGVFAEWQLTEHLSLTPRAGYSLYQFLENAAGFDPGHSAAGYFGLMLSHRLSESLTYRLTADHQVSPGVRANLSEVWRLGIDSSWSVVRRLPIGVGMFVERGEQGESLQTERYDRIGASFGVSYQWTPSLDLSLNYSFTLRDSDLLNHDYLQNKLALRLNYKL